MQILIHVGIEINCDENFITYRTESSKNDNLQCRQLLKFSQNGDIFVSVTVYKISVYLYDHSALIVGWREQHSHITPLFN